MGEGRGEGTTLNLAFGDGGVGVVDGDLLSAVMHVVLPVAYQFRPQVVLVAAGFGALRGDFIGGCNRPGEGQMRKAMPLLGEGEEGCCLGTYAHSNYLAKSLRLSFLVRHGADLSVDSHGATPLSCATALPIFVTLMSLRQLRPQYVFAPAPRPCPRCARFLPSAALVRPRL